MPQERTVEQTANRMRVIVTGSRDWPASDPWMIHAVLDWFARLDEPLTVVVGYDPVRQYPPGVDRITYERCIDAGYDVETHPADWDRYGPAAGPLRNQEMVAAGGDVCVAFAAKRIEDSRGTHGCAKLARAASILVYVVERLTPATT